MTIEDKIMLDPTGRLQLIKRGTHIEIVLQWFGLRSIIASGFAIGWIVYVWNGYISGRTIAFTGSDVGFLLHNLFALALVYVSFAYWLNRTRLVVGMGSMKVSHGPIPWLGGRDIPLSDVKQFRALTVAHQRGGETHELNVELRSGGTITLMKDLHTLDEGMKIEQRLEAYLHIKDEPVEGGA